MPLIFNKEVNIIKGSTPHSKRTHQTVPCYTNLMPTPSSLLDRTATAMVIPYSSHQTGAKRNPTEGLWLRIADWSFLKISLLGVGLGKTPTGKFLLRLSRHPCLIQNKQKTKKPNILDRSLKNSLSTQAKGHCIIPS